MVIEIKKYELDKPDEIVKMSIVLKNHIVSQKLYTNIQGRNYVHVEGWQFAGSLLGIIPRIVQVENLSIGKVYKWKADSEIVNTKNGEIIARGFAICSSDELKKKSFDEYAVLSMAQTRAIGKAYRNVIGWIMKLSGYESTPAEEIMREEVTPMPKEDVPQQKHYECHEGAEIITKAEYDYSLKIYKKPLCRKHQPKSSKR